MSATTEGDQLKRGCHALTVTPRCYFAIKPNGAKWHKIGHKPCRLRAMESDDTVPADLSALTRKEWQVESLLKRAKVAALLGEYWFV